ncbi:hypothetical protein PInf_009991 [Phytophthora infestans]|nr:hypothetical protein PInf_009991 [Phytophthora infestans]
MLSSNQPCVEKIYPTAKDSTPAVTTSSTVPAATSSSASGNIWAGSDSDFVSSPEVAVASDTAVVRPVKRRKVAAKGKVAKVKAIKPPLDGNLRSRNPWKPSTQVYRNICLLCCEEIKARKNTTPYSWEDALRSTKNTSNAKEHIKSRHADHPLAILAEQTTAQKAKDDVMSAEDDTRVVLDLTCGGENDATTSAPITTGSSAGNKSLAKRFFKADEKTLHVLISKWLITQGIPHPACRSGPFEEMMRAATGKMEAVTHFIANLALVEVQSENLVSSYMVVFRRLAEKKLKSFKFDTMVIEAPRAKDGNEASHRRVVRKLDQFTVAGKSCLRSTLLQLQSRFPKVTREAMVCILLDPRTKSSAKKIAAVGNVSRKEEKATYKNGLEFLRDEHQKVFAQMAKVGKMPLSQTSSQSSLLSQDLNSPLSSPSSTGWDDEDELLLGALIRTSKTREEVKESELNARADSIKNEWLEMEPEWLEIAQR